MRASAPVPVQAGPGIADATTVVMSHLSSSSPAVTSGLRLELSLRLGSYNTRFEFPAVSVIPESDLVYVNKRGFMQFVDDFMHRIIRPVFIDLVSRTGQFNNWQLQLLPYFDEILTFYSLDGDYCPRRDIIAALIRMSHTKSPEPLQLQLIPTDGLKKFLTQALAAIKVQWSETEFFAAKQGFRDW